MLKTTITSCWLLLATLAWGQKIATRVVNTAGGSAQVGNLNFSYAVGEPITTTLTDSKNAATQGVLQPEIRTTGLFYIAIGEDCDFNIFPNPTRADLTSNGDLRGRTFEIYNTLGQLMGQFNANGSNRIDITYFASGTYFIRLICDPTHYKVLKFIKL
jgi:Secretion system C-terminal sorting domain